MTQSLSPSARRRRWYYVATLVLFVALIGGWSWLWYDTAVRTSVAIEGWRVREAKSGRLYTCGSESIGGYPFRIEVNCDRASALISSNQAPVEIKAGGILIAAQIYQRDLLISELRGPLTIAEPGRAPNIVVNWKLAQSSVRGTPAAPQRVALVFDQPVIDRVTGGVEQKLLQAKHAEIHGRIAEGSAANRPVIEIALQLDQASAPGLHPAVAQPIDADVIAVLRGLNDFSPKPWPQRFREMQAAGGRIDISQARVQQGETIAVGGGSLSLNANGRLEGQLRVTIAGLEPFLAAIGAQQMVQTSPTVNRLSGALDRLSPGLGNVARQQIGANISTGINMIGEQTTLEGKRAVTLPLRFEDGVVLLGPIRIGDAPALF
jgi:hypothetical protein